MDQIWILFTVYICKHLQLLALMKSSLIRSPRAKCGKIIFLRIAMSFLSNHFCFSVDSFWNGNNNSSNREAVSNIDKREKIVSWGNMLFRLLNYSFEIPNKFSISFYRPKLMVLVKRYRADKYFHIFLSILILFVLYTYVYIYIR